MGEGTPGKNRKVRYAVVALGHIAQIAILPAFAAASNNSELVALVSGDPIKLKVKSREYKVPAVYSYEQLDECLASENVDAVFIALPNDMHREFTIRAARAKVHVLCEKPLALTEKDCLAMIQAAQKSGVKFMTAYRLHTEETNLRAIELIKSKKIGEPRIFNSLFSFHVTDQENIRLKKARGGGPVYDIGTYCINAARYIFQAEPEEVSAFTASNKERRFKEVEEMASVIMRFPGERLASFTCSFGAADSGYFEVIGTKGTLRVDPAYEYAEPLAMELTIDGKAKKQVFPKRDQFAAEISYFSDCILKNRQPEPSGWEGLADIRIIEAIHRSARTGKAVRLKPFTKKDRPSIRQEIRKPASKEPRLVNVKSPH
ncbi:MAG: Gfo/Idh/MocA family oxidoreductase [Verrucomicrobiota bacterium]|nr:Gfo/Idh/MocA family oxidoreductase [Verrucomicrobiota bacterium]